MRQKKYSIKLNQIFKNYINHHIHSASQALGQFKKTKWLYAMTLAVIGVAIAMPLGFYLMFANVNKVLTQWQSQAQLSLFLKNNIDDGQLEKFKLELKQLPAVTDIEWIDKTSALHEFEKIAGLNDITAGLGENPLPDVLNITLKKEVPIYEMKRLKKLLMAKPQVDLAILDSEWLERLSILVAIIKRITTALTIILCLAVVLIISNSIRLMIEARKEEIEVISLIGATKAFVRRPFLYTGMWLGFIGGLLACLTTALGVFYLNGPIHQLGHLYQTQWQGLTLPLSNYCYVIFFSTFMGLIGSWFAVNKQLRQSSV